MCSIVIFIYCYYSSVVKYDLTGTAEALHFCKAHAKINRKMGNSTPPL